MREQRFNKIKNVVFILLAVFLVISLTAASASAWYSKTSDGKCKEISKEKVVKEAKEKPTKEVVKERAAKKVVKEKVVKKVAKEKVVKKVATEKVVKKAARERVFDRKIGDEKQGNKLLEFVENNWFSIGRGSNCDNGWGGNCDNGWLGNDWDNC